MRREGQGGRKEGGISEKGRVEKHQGWRGTERKGEEGGRDKREREGKGGEEQRKKGRGRREGISEKESRNR